jgi:hypothetical protein
MICCRIPRCPQPIKEHGLRRLMTHTTAKQKLEPRNLVWHDIADGCASFSTTVGRRCHAADELHVTNLLLSESGSHFALGALLHANVAYESNALQMHYGVYGVLMLDWGLMV